MKKIFLLANFALLLAGCVNPVVEEAKPHYIGKQIGYKYNFSSHHRCPISAVEDDGYVRDYESHIHMYNAGLTESLFTITGAGYKEPDSFSCGGYYLKAQRENDSKKYRIYIGEETLKKHEIPSLWANKEEFQKILKKQKQEEKAVDDRKEEKKKAVAVMVNKFIKAAPEWEELKIAPNCPLPLIAGAAVTLKCKNMDVTTLSGKRLSVKMRGCFIGDISFIFQYGSKFVVPEQITAEGRTRYSQFENLTGDAYNYCLMGAATFNGEL